MFSIAVVYFMIYTRRKEKTGFLFFFILEITYRWIGIIIIESPYPEIRVQKVVLYLIYMVMRMVWMIYFAENAFRNYLEIYFALFIGTSLITFGMGIAALRNELLSSIIAGYVNNWKELLLYWGGPCLISLIVSVGVFKLSWLRRMSTILLLYIYLFAFVLGEIVFSIMFYAERVTDLTIVIFIILQLLMLLIGIQYAYMNQQSQRMEEENERLEKIVQEQYLYYKELCRKKEVIRIVRHELANHLQVMHGLEKNKLSECAEEYRLRLKDSYLKLGNNASEKALILQDRVIVKRMLIKYMIYFLVFNVVFFIYIAFF